MSASSIDQSFVSMADLAVLPLDTRATTAATATTATTALSNSQENPNVKGGVAASVKQTQSTALSSQEFWSLLLASGTTGVEEVDGAAPTTHTSKTRTTAANKFTSTANSKYMGPPPAPRVNVTPRTQAAYESLAQEINTAFAGAKQSAATAPKTSTASQGSSASPTSPSAVLNAPASVAAGAATKYLQSIMGNLDNMQNGLLYQFMQLRLSNSYQGMQDLQNLSSLASDVQSTMIKQEEAKTQQALKQSQKAQKKAGFLGFLNKVLGVIMLVLAATLAIASFGTLTIGLAVVMGAMFAGFMAGGLVGGHGHGFNFWDGITGATIAADVVAIAPLAMAGMSALMATARTALAEGGTAAMTKLGAQQAQEAVAQAAAKSTKSAAATAADVVGSVGATTAEELAEQTLTQFTQRMSSKEAQDAIEKALAMVKKAHLSVGTVAEKATAKEMQAAVEEATKLIEQLAKEQATGLLGSIPTEVSEASAKAINTLVEHAGNVTRYGGAMSKYGPELETWAAKYGSTDPAVWATKYETEGVGESSLFRRLGMSETFGTKFEDFMNTARGDNWAGDALNKTASGEAINGFGTRASTTVKEQLNKLGSKLGMRGLGDSSMLAELLIGGFQLVAGVTQAGGQYAVSIAQTDAEADLAQVQVYQTVSTLFDRQYNSLTDAIQAFTDAHGKTVDCVNAILKSLQQANQAQINGLAHR